MNKTFKQTITAVLLVIIVIIGFNFESIFLLPRYHRPIIDNMIDPTSVLFKNEKFNGQILCGEFNSKNRMGAYTGFNRFISSPYQAYLVDDELSSDGSKLDEFFGFTPALGAVGFQMAISQTLAKNGRATTEENLWWDKQQRFDNMWYGICTNE